MSALGCDGDGWRELKGDVNGDGFVDIIDLVTIAIAYDWTPGESHWNPYADVDGNCVVDIVDVVIAARDFNEEANRIDGSYSWRTNGVFAYYMRQYLDTNTVAAIAGQKVTFGFWFLPDSESIQSYSSSLDAWSESLSPLEGAWSSGTGCGNVYLSSSQKLVGSYSIEHRTETSDYYGCLVFTLHDGMEVNTYVYTPLAFYLRLESSFSGSVTVRLEDYAGMVVYKDLEFPVNEWNKVTLGVGYAHRDEWEHSVFNDQPFNWASVKKIAFYSYFTGTGTGSFWIDRPFFVKPIPARAEMTYTYGGGQMRWVGGDWITPTELEWYHAYVTKTFPSTLESVRVTIHAYPNFKAHIDSASLSVCFDETQHDTYGDVTLGASLYHLDTGIQGENWDGVVKLVPAVSAVANDGYKVMDIQLRIELWPNDGSQTEQVGSIEITGCNQENDKNYDTDPQCQVGHEPTQVEQLSRILVVVAGLTTAIVFAVGITYVTGGTGTGLAYAALKATAGWLLGQFTTNIVTIASSTPDDPNANAFMNPSDYYVHEKWTYSQSRWDPDDFVNQAGGSFYLAWLFDSDSSPETSLKIEATVNWGIPVKTYPGGYYTLCPAGSTTVTQIITV